MPDDTLTVITDEGATQHQVPHLAELLPPGEHNAVALCDDGTTTNVVVAVTRT